MRQEPRMAQPRRSTSDRRRRPCRPVARRGAGARRHRCPPDRAPAPGRDRRGARRRPDAWRCLPAASRIVRRSASGPRRRPPSRDRAGRGRRRRWRRAGHYDSAAHGKGRSASGSSTRPLRRGLLQAFLDHAGAAAYSGRGRRAAPRGDATWSPWPLAADRGAPSWSVPTAAARGSASWPGSRSTAGPTTSRP